MIVKLVKTGYQGSFGVDWRQHYDRKPRGGVESSADSGVSSVLMVGSEEQRVLDLGSVALDEIQVQGPSELQVRRRQAKAGGMVEEHHEPTCIGVASRKLL